MADSKSQIETSTTASGTKPGGDSNPFTADLKGEFHSNFGATTPVSNVLGGGDGGKKRKMLLGGIAVLALGFAAYVKFSEPASEEGASEEDLVTEEDSEAKESEGTLAETKKESSKASENTDDKTDAPVAETGTQPSVPKGEGQEVTKDMAKPVDSTMPATEAPVVQVPTDGQSRTYDETSEDATFKWSGSPGAEVYFSRNSNFSPVARKVRVEGNSYEFRDPWPGKWYMKVVNGAGTSSVVSFVVDGPERRNVSITSPADGQTISGSGGVVAWSGDAKVARYKVEFSKGDWAQPAYKLQTVGTEAKLNGVPAGSYKMRVAAWSEVSGRWEYSAPVGVAVQ